MKKKLPVGTQDYKRLRMDNYYTVDKTMIIAEFLERGSAVTLITRPRRFGKTLTVSMMAEFFDITKDSKLLFEGLSIMNTPYVKEMNQYPTIFLTFADAKDDIVNVVKTIKLQLLKEYGRYAHALENIPVYSKAAYDLIWQGLNDLTDISLSNINNAIAFLMEQLELYYGKKVMLYIDEYDTPFIEAHVHHFYDELHSGLSSLMRTALKNSTSLQYAMITGIQRVAKENIFSDLNNIDVCTVKDIDYAQYFGFTEEETKELLQYYGYQYTNEVKQMYDGYHIGNVHIFNPWSIIKYARNGVLEPFWVNTSSNTMIKNAMKKAKEDFKKDFEKLIKQGSLTTTINIESSFYEQKDTPSLWGLLVNAGYLTIVNAKKHRRCEIVIPNNEVREEFISLTANYLQIEDTKMNDLFANLKEKNAEAFLQEYQDILLKLPSYHDLKEENSYHMLFLGICAWFQNDYVISSNREQGHGRCDIILSAKESQQASYVIEFKYTKDESVNLHDLAYSAVQQIQDSQYDYELTGDVIHIGLAHRHKEADMVWQMIRK